MPFKISSAIVSTFELPICWICRYSFQINKSSDPAYPLSFFPFFFFFFRRYHPAINSSLAEHPRRTSHRSYRAISDGTPAVIILCLTFPFQWLVSVIKSHSPDPADVSLSNPRSCFKSRRWLHVVATVPTVSHRELIATSNVHFMYFCTHTPTGVTHRRPRDFRS